MHRHSFSFCVLMDIIVRIEQQASLPELTKAQTTKMKQLTILSLAMTDRVSQASPFRFQFDRHPLIQSCILDHTLLCVIVNSRSPIRPSSRRFINRIHLRRFTHRSTRSEGIETRSNRLSRSRRSNARHVYERHLDGS